MTEANSPVDPSRYTGVAIVLHWLVAALIAVNLVIIWFVDDWPKDWTRPVIDLHKSLGITVLGLVLLRLLWRAGHRPPPLPESYPPLERKAAALGHLLLYGLILALPLSGWLHDSAWRDAASHPMSLFGLVPWPRIGLIMSQPAPEKERLHDLFFLAHKSLAYGLYVMFVLHVGAALKHQWIDRKPELQRMWR
jgi:cytochrome b561